MRLTETNSRVLHRLSRLGLHEPAAYVDGANLYQFELANSGRYVDPSGENAAGILIPSVLGPISGAIDAIQDWSGLRQNGYSRTSATAMAAARRIPIASTATKIQELQLGKSTHGADYNRPLSKGDKARKGAEIAIDVAASIFMIDAAGNLLEGETPCETGSLRGGEVTCFTGDTLVLTGTDEAIGHGELVGSNLPSDAWSPFHIGVELVVLGAYGTYLIQRARRCLWLKKVEEELAAIRPLEFPLHPRSRRQSARMLGPYSSSSVFCDYVID